MKYKLTSIILSLTMAISPIFAGISGGSKGSSGGWGGSRSSSTPSRPSTPSVTPSKPSSSPSSSSWGKSTTTPTKSSSDASSALKQKQSIAPPKPRSEYVNDFKQKNADKYKNDFKTEPTTRPSYIPQTTVVGGTTVNIIHNPGYGGYGYYNALGAFILFDALTYHAHENYSRDVSYYNNQPVVYDNSFGMSFSGFILGVFKFFLIIFVIVALLGLVKVFID